MAIAFFLASGALSCKPNANPTHEVSEKQAEANLAETTSAQPSGTTSAATSPEEPPAEKPPEQRKLLITIDDLPLADFDRRKSKRERQEIVEKLTAVLQKEQVPFVAFMNMEQDREDKNLLAPWQGTKATFGNHTWSHPHPRRAGTEAYIKDLKRGHEAVVPLREGAKGPMPFRYPYLYEGFPCEQRDAIRETLRALDARNVPVTIDPWDWYYARRRLKALQSKEAEDARLLEGAYMGSLQEATLEAEWYAEALFKRQPPQVLLLHGNTLVADMLPETLNYFRDRGYTFVTLEEVWADPAYAEPDHTATPRGFSHWKRLMRSREGLGTCPVTEASEANKNAE